MKITFKPAAHFETSSLQGRIQTRYADLVACFGEPNSSGDDYKVQKRWQLKFADGTYATIYDYKEGDSYNGPGQGTHYTKVTDWHIGGTSQRSVAAIEQAMDKYLNQLCIEQPKLSV
jgi:hypothetical protein